jgi:hypothetical protein
MVPPWQLHTRWHLLPVFRCILGAILFVNYYVYKTSSLRRGHLSTLTRHRKDETDRRCLV